MNVTDFGPWVDGQDCTATLAAALSAAGSNLTDRTVHMPAIPDTSGGVQIKASMSSPLVIPSGVTLAGAGTQTHLTVVAASYSAVGSYSVFQASGNNIIRDFQLDGNKTNIGTTPPTGSYGNIGIFIPSGATQVVCDNITVHDFFNYTGESFGIDAQGGTTAISILNCVGYNMIGSPFSLTGSSAVAPYGSANHVIMNCIAYGNTYQGITIYQDQYVLVQGCQAYGNDQRGINMEWCDSISVVGNLCYGNLFAGIGTYGVCSNILIANNVLNQNVQHSPAYAEMGEIDFAEDTNGSRTGGIATAWVYDNLIIPGQTGYISIDERNSSTNTGLSVATTVWVGGTDIDNWNYYINTSPYDQTYSPNGLRIKTGFGRPLAAGAVSSWATQTHVTLSAPPSGAEGANAKTVTVASGQVGTLATATTLIPAGRRVKIHYRAQVQDTHATYEIRVSDGTTNIKRIQLPQTTNDLSEWIEGEFIATNPVGGTSKGVYFVTTGAASTTSVAAVDFIAVSELEYLGSLSEYTT